MHFTCPYLHPFPFPATLCTWDATFSLHVAMRRDDFVLLIPCSARPPSRASSPKQVRAMQVAHCKAYAIKHRYAKGAHR